MRIEADIDGQSFPLMWMLNYSFVGRVKWQKVGTNCDEDSNETCVQAKVVWVWNGVALEVAAAILSTHPHGQLFLLNTQNQMSIILCESAAAKTTTNMINSIHAVFLLLFCVMALHKWHLCAYAGTLIPMKKNGKQQQTCFPREKKFKLIFSKNKHLSAPTQIFLKPNELDSNLFIFDVGAFFSPALPRCQFQFIHSNACAVAFNFENLRLHASLWNCHFIVPAETRALLSRERTYEYIGTWTQCTLFGR